MPLPSYDELVASPDEEENLPSYEDLTAPAPSDVGFGAGKALPMPEGAPGYDEFAATPEGQKALAELRPPPSEPYGSVLGHLERVKQQEGVVMQTIGGLSNIGADLAESLTTPENLVLLPATTVRGVGRLAGLLFGAQALSDVPEAIGETIAPDKTLQERIESGGRTLTDIVFGGLGVGHGTGALDILSRKSRTTKQPKSEPSKPVEALEPASALPGQALVETAPTRQAARIDEGTGLPLNEDGTVTLYHGTTKEGAAGISESGRLTSAGEPDIYLTTEPTGTGYGDGTVVSVKVDPLKLKLDDEFPSGRKDFRAPKDLSVSTGAESVLQEPKPLAPEKAVGSPEGEVAKAESTTGLGELGRAGDAIVSNMYEAMFQKLQKGDLTEGGQPSSFLKSAQSEFEAGKIKSPDDLRSFANDVKAEAEAIIQKYKPLSPEAVEGQPGAVPVEAAQVTQNPVKPGEFQKEGYTAVEPKPSEPVAPKPSKIGQSIEAKAVEAKLTAGFSETAGYDPITIQDQAQRATGLIKSSIEDARAVIRGEAPLPEGLRGTSLITAMEEQLLRKPDAQAAYELANSPLTSATSAAAQEMRLMAERVPDSITAKFQEIREARRAGSKQRGETTEQVVKDIKTELVKNSSKRPTWEAWVKEITC